MANLAQTTTKRAAKGGTFALLAGLLAALCTPLTARAEEPSRSQLTVTAEVRSSCQVDAGQDVAFKCTRAVAPQTSIAYEAVGSEGSATGDRHLVVTVNF